MQRLFFGRWLGALAVYSVACVSMRAPDVISNVWTSYNTDNSWTNGANWQSGVAPANPLPPLPGTANILFASATARSDVFLNASQNIGSLTITDPVNGDINFKASSNVTLTIQSGVLFAPANSHTLSFGKLVGIALPAAEDPQPWIVSGGSTIDVAGSVSGFGGILLFGGGNLVLRNANSFSGGVTLVASQLIFGTNSALGTGTLNLDGGTLVPDGGSRTIANLVKLVGDTTIDASRAALTVSGQVDLMNSSALTVNGGHAVTLTGAISDLGAAITFTKDGSGALILAGAVNTIADSFIVVDAGQLIFASASAVPATGNLMVNSGGYVGAGLTTGVQAGFINRVYADSSGAIGFDTANPAVPVTISDNIDLTRFGSTSTIRLGSATSAILTGTITPQSNTYHFGSGGGTLVVASNLTNVNSDVSRSLSVDSADGQPLTLVLSGTDPNHNTYSGSTTINNSLLRIGSVAAFPSNTSGINISPGSYLGFDYDLTSTDLATLIGNLSTRISANSPFVFGLDSSTFPSDTAIDLTPFSNGETLHGAYLGTSSIITINGVITPSGGGSSPYRFASVKGGQLTIASLLDDPLAGGHRGVEIGAHPYLVGSGSGNGPDGFVALTAANTYSGGTTLYNGRLVLGTSSFSSEGTIISGPLGTGTLTVSSYQPNDAFLEVSTPGLAIGNAIYLSDVGDDATLNVGGSNSFTLGGNITGTGGLVKYGPNTLTLNGANDFDYLTINQGTVAFGTDSSTPSGLLKIGEAAAAAFLSGAPAINGLDGEPGAIVNLSSDTTLTINVADHNRFAGAIAGSGRIEIDGPGRLELGASLDERLQDGTTLPPISTFSGGARITGGTVELRNGSALGTGNVTIVGGKLSLDLGVTLSNPIAFISGAIGGFGTFAPSGGITIRSGDTLAPGLHDAAVGTLNFANGLTLAHGGTYAWNIAYAGGANGPTGNGIVWDQVEILSGNLNITADSESPFYIRLSTTDLTGASLALPTFDNTIGHSWAIISVGDGSINGFNPAAFTIDTSGFLNSLGTGQFDISQSGSNLMLNFMPVPEPSTWALLLCGAGAVLFPALKRRRRT